MAALRCATPVAEWLVAAQLTCAQLWRAATLFVVCLLAMAHAVADELQLYTEENPPLNFTRDGQLTGFSTEVVTSMAVRAGDTVQIQSAPWTRGYAKAQSTANVGIFTMARTAERAPAFQWVGPISLSQNRFYTRKGSGLRIDTMAEAQAKLLVLPREWYTYQYLVDQGFSNIYTVPTAERMMQMFHHGRGDLLAVSDIGLPALLALAGMTPDQLEPQLVFMQHESYLAFSLATDPARVSRWQVALDEMKRDGSFVRIFERWFPNRTLPPRLLELSP